MRETLTLSPLPKTWIFDLDGTIVKHNGYKTTGMDSLLAGAKDFIDTISNDDMIVIITSRKEEFADITENFLKKNHIRFDHIIYGAPYGERIIINDNKPSGLTMAYAISNERDNFIEPCIEINDAL